jgi:formylglycine-generating enzyme required for sulfatase activity
VYCLRIPCDGGRGGGLRGGAGGEGDDTSSDTDTGTDTDSDTESETECNPDEGLDTDGIPQCEEPDCPPVEWVAIEGGSFEMGREEVTLYGEYPEQNEQPEHQVEVPAFEMLRTEVTVEQYRSCFEAAVCTEPQPVPDEICFWSEGEEYDGHSINCVDWFQAGTFCVWVGGRLPTEAEWEYAARSGGQHILFPWGDEEATCEHAVIGGPGEPPCCGAEICAPCSKPPGATDQGLCDMSGNVYEWVQDRYHEDYDGAPSDGSAWETPADDWPVCVNRATRSGSVLHDWYGARTTKRFMSQPQLNGGFLGFRCAR